MSRVKRFAFSIVSGYAALAANILFSLVSVPLAMHYLSNEEFGLWVVAAQVAAYLGLIEFGMTGSISRILVDHKDDPGGGEYGAVIKTGALVLFVQGLAVLLAGLVLGVWLGVLFDVPAKYVRDFQWLLGGQALLLGTFFSARVFGFVLQAHQRYDDFNGSQILSFIVNLGVLWVAFAMNLGVYSLLVGTAAGTIVSTAYCLFAVSRRGLWPHRGRWGKINKRTFQEMFQYGTDIFLLSVGQQLISASQLLVLSRVIGLEAAALWSVATKLFAVAQQLVWRILDFSGAALAEMIVRGEKERLRVRFRDVVVLTASASVVAGTVMAICNRGFLELYSRGRLAWGIENDILMAVSVIVYAGTRCHTGLTGLTKQIRAMKYTYLIEGVTFVGLGYLTATRFGIGGVIASGIVTNLVCSGVYGIWRTTDYLGIAAAEALSWWRGPLRLAVALVVVSVPLWVLTRSLPAAAQFAINATVAGLAGLWGFWNLGLPQTMQQELAGLLVKARHRFQGA
jgi:O-antigen/teichoic acid export membrane protein